MRGEVLWGKQPGVGSSNMVLQLSGVATTLARSKEFLVVQQTVNFAILVWITLQVQIVECDMRYTWDVEVILQVVMTVVVRYSDSDMDTPETRTRWTCDVVYQV